MSKLNKRIDLWGLITAAACFGAIGVIAGAFGAHALRETLEATGRLEVWKTAVLYNLLHAVVVFSTASTGRAFRIPGWLWMTGGVLFSGSLYILALGGPRWLGPITPVGGALLVLGWLWAGASALAHRPEDSQ